jgi:hypothetical protein
MGILRVPARESMSSPEIFAPIRDLDVGDALEEWRGVVGMNVKVRLLTAMGDLFVIKPGFFGGVLLLDLCSGELCKVASSWKTFKGRMANPDAEVSNWLKYDLLSNLHERGGGLEEGQCYSPRIPPMLGGKYEPANFEPTAWRVHVDLMGQIYQQVKELPPGTPITGVRWR